MSFSQQISLLNKGMLNDELSEELAHLVKNVRQTGKKGSITLTLELTPYGEDTVEILPKIVCKMPEAPRAKSIMYTTYDGDLLRDDPNKEKVNLKTVGDAPRELRKAQ